MRRNGSGKPPVRRAGGHGVGQGEERPSVGTWPRLKGGVMLAFKNKVCSNKIFKFRERWFLPLAAKGSMPSPMALTPPTPSSKGLVCPSSRRTSDKPPRGLLLPLHGANGTTPIGTHCAPALCTPVGAALCTPVGVDERHTPPSDLRRESLNVPQTQLMIRLAQGSGVSVYRMDRSPRDGKPRSPWALKKANVSPVLVSFGPSPTPWLSRPPDG